MLKAVQMDAKHVLYVRTLLRTLQVGIENTNPLIKNLSRLLRKNLCSSVRVSTVLLRGTMQHSADKNNIDTTR